MWELIALMEAYLVLVTSSSAECERGVSVLKLVKMARRNSMTQATLEQLLMIKINGRGSGNTHDFDEAAVIFFSKKARRLTVGSAYKMRAKSEYKWGDVCGKNEVEGEEERAFSEEDVKSQILTGTAPADSLQASAEKTAEKAGKLNAEGQKLKRAAEKKEKEDEVTRKKRKL
jgi:hypothetical protein